MQTNKKSSLCLAFLAFIAWAASVTAESIDVLWYTYADPLSQYRSATGIPGIAANAASNPESSGLSWNLTFFDLSSPTPDFSAYDVLVTHSGEAFRTAPPGGQNVTPNFTGILSNKPLIEAARGDRTVISATDADFHAIRGDTGHCAPFAGCGYWDGALGHLVNMVNWAASGNGLGIVALLDGEFQPVAQRWWQQPDSFLYDELLGNVSYFRDNFPTELADHPLNAGLTSLGLTEWRNSFHAGFDTDIPGYEGIVYSTARPGVPVVIAKIDAPSGPGIVTQVPVPAFASGCLVALLVVIALRAREKRDPVRWCAHLA